MSDGSVDVQAVEAKHNLTIGFDSDTQATVTFQMFFRYYTKLAGMTVGVSLPPPTHPPSPPPCPSRFCMWHCFTCILCSSCAAWPMLQDVSAKCTQPVNTRTSNVTTHVAAATAAVKPNLCMQGTAITEAEEFHDVYKLNVVQIPSRLPNRRCDHPARMFLYNEHKLISIYIVVMQAYWQQRPVLIGTSNVEESEKIFRLLEGTLWEPLEFESNWWRYGLTGMRRFPGRNAVL